MNTSKCATSILFWSDVSPWLIIVFGLLAAPSAFCEAPQISEGVRVLMFSGSGMEQERTSSSPIQSFFIPRQLEVLDPDLTSEKVGGLGLTSPIEVINFFLKLRSDTQRHGLWLTYLGATATVDFDRPILSELIDQARKRDLLVYECYARRSTKPAATYVAWSCAQVSPKQSAVSIMCEPREKATPTGTPQWDCLQ